MDTTQRRVLGLVAVATWFVIDAVRTAGPLLSDLFDVGVEVAAGVGFAAFVIGGTMAAAVLLLSRRAGHGTVLVALAVVLVLMRFTLPFLDTAVLIAVGLLMTVGAIAYLLTAARVALVNAGSGSLAAGTAVGASFAIIEQTVLRTWDAVWRSDTLGWTALVILAVLMLVSAWTSRSLNADAPTRGWWAYGLVFSLLYYAFANIAFVNSQTELRMSIASVAVVGGLLAGAFHVSRMSQGDSGFTVALMVLGVGALALVMFSPGTLATMATPVAAAMLIIAVSHALKAPVGNGTVPAPASAIRLAFAGAAFGFLSLVPFMLVQLDYDIPIGVPHVLPITVGGAAVFIAAGLAASQARTPDAPRTAIPAVTIAVVGVAGLAALSSLWTYTEYEQPRAYPADFIGSPQVMVWNVHYGVTPGFSGGPGVDLDHMLAEIEAVNPDVLLLQEVNRGWILGGGLDLLEYFAGVLPMEFAYQGAHDPQFGNAIFTNRPMTNIQRIALPYGDGPQRRSAVAGDFMGATYVSTHLQHKQRDDTRVAQAQSLLDQLEAPGPVVVGGDYNDLPDSRAVQVMIDDGYEVASYLDGIIRATYIKPGSERQIDYIFGRDVAFDDFEIVDSPWSDHLPLVVRVTPDNAP